MTSQKSILEIRRHPLLTAILLGVVFSVVCALYLALGEAHEFERVVSLSMLDGGIYSWQLNHRLISYIFIGCVIAYLSIKMGQLSARYNLYGVTTHLSMELFPLLLMGVMINASSLRGVMVVMLVIFSLARYMGSYRAANCAGALLSGGFALGAAALLYPPAILLWGVVPVMVVLFDRTMREVIVAHVSLLFVPFACLYIRWLGGADFAAMVGEFLGKITLSSGFSILDSFRGVTIVMLALVLYMTINAIFAISLLENTVKAKRRLRLVVIYALASVAMMALPSADSLIFWIFAIPAALLIPVTMLKVGRLISFILYVALFVGVALTIFGF